MDFGFSLPGRGPLATPDVLIKLAHKADDLRYSSIFVTDHVVIPTTQTTPYPYAPTGKFAGDWTNGYLEPLALMSFLAGETSRVRLGTSVLVIPYRNPVVTAKMLATPTCSPAAASSSARAWAGSRRSSRRFTRNPSSAAGR